MTTPEPSEPHVYKDDDLVYVDPDTKKVVGLVEWGKNEKPKSKPYKPVVVDDVAAQPAKKGERKGQFWRKNFPWGTYKSMRRIYKLEGKTKDPEPNKSLEEVLPKALNEAFWDWGAKKKTDESGKSTSV